MKIEWARKNGPKTELFEKLGIGQVFTIFNACDEEVVDRVYMKTNSTCALCFTDNQLTDIATLCLCVPLVATLVIERP
jgi:hypothetical protein